jgi:hypothetical protein
MEDAVERTKKQGIEAEKRRGDPSENLQVMSAPVKGTAAVKIRGTRETTSRRAPPLAMRPRAATRRRSSIPTSSLHMFSTAGQSPRRPAFHHSTVSEI